MESLLLLLLGAFLLLSPVLAIAALVRASRVTALERRVQSLQRRVDVLQEELRERGSPAPAGEAAAGREEPPRRPAVLEAPSPPASREELRPQPAHAEGAPPAPPETTPERAADVEPEPEPARPRRPAVDWEQWIGVRGAGLVGGIVLALAGILTFKHLIDEGYITPERRVLGGAVAGVLALVASLVARRRDLRVVPGALAGAGVVTLYASSWAAHRLYGLVPFGVSWVAMAVTTAACIALSVVHRARLVALLGLVGGFAAPLVLAGDLEHPLATFGYFLLLDVGLLAVARRMRWPLLGLLGVGATFTYQVLWAVLRLDLDGMTFALFLTGTFAVLFAVGGSGLTGRNGIATRTAGVLLPFLLALHFGSSGLAERLWPLALLLLLLVVAAVWTARRTGPDWLPHAAAGGVLGVVLTWAQERALDGPLLVELVLVCVGFAVLFQAADELLRRRGGGAERVPLAPATLFAGGALLLTTVVAGRPAEVPTFGPWPLLAGWIALALVLARQSLVRARVHPYAIGALLLPCAWALWGSVHEHLPAHPGPLAFAAVAVGIVALSHGLAWRVAARVANRRPWALAGLSVAPLLLVLSLSPQVQRSPYVALVALLALSLFAASATATTRTGAWAYGAVLACAIFQHPVRDTVGLEWSEPFRGGIVALSWGSLLAFLVLPLALRSMRADAWRAAAFACAVWCLTSWPLHERVFPELSVALVPAGSGAAALGTLALMLGREREPATRRAGIVALAGVGVALVALAPAVWVDRYPAAVGAATAALALALLWNRLDHPALKVGSAAGVVVGLGAVARSLVLTDHYPRGSGPVADWIGYGVLLPGALVLVAAFLFGQSERERMGEDERRLTAGLPWATGVAGVAGLLLLFAWINLEIYDHFGEGRYVTLEVVRHQARDLATSIAWALYALAILGTGMVRRQVALRWASLGFLVLSLLKVFLYDLGELEGMHRVASLAGLALSLLLVSALYQRFVFRARAS